MFGHVNKALYFDCCLKLCILSQEEKKETPLLVQKTNDYLQSLREKWEEKEREMVGQDRDVHYQDLLFDGVFLIIFLRLPMTQITMA